MPAVSPPRRTFLRRPPTPYLAGVAALYLLFWGLGAATEPFTAILDAREYLQQAENLEAGRGWYAGDPVAPYDPALFSRRPPGYAFFLVALRVVTEHPLWVAAVQSALGVLVWVVLWDLLVRLGLPRRWGWLVAGLALAPGQLVTAQMLMSDLVFQVLLVGAFWGLVRYVLGEGRRWLVLWQVLLALGVLVKPVLLFFWVPNLALSLWLVLQRERRWRARWPAALALLLPVAVGSVSLVNEAETGYYHYSSLKTENLLRHNAARTAIRALGEDAADDFVEPVWAQAGQIADFEEREQFKEQAAWRIIFAHLDTYVTLHLQGMAAFLVDPGRYDLYAFFGDEPPARGLTHAFTVGGVRGLGEALSRQHPAELVIFVLLTLWNVFVLIAAVVFLFDPRVPLPVRVAAFVIAGYLVAVTGPVGAARYRLPIYPLLLLAVPFFETRLRARFRRPAGEAIA